MDKICGNVGFEGYLDSGSLIFPIYLFWCLSIFRLWIIKMPTNFSLRKWTGIKGPGLTLILCYWSMCCCDDESESTQVITFNIYSNCCFNDAAKCVRILTVGQASRCEVVKVTLSSISSEYCIYFVVTFINQVKQIMCAVSEFVFIKADPNKNFIGISIYCTCNKVQE